MKTNEQTEQSHRKQTGRLMETVKTSKYRKQIATIVSMEIQQYHQGKQDQTT